MSVSSTVSSISTVSSRLVSSSGSSSVVGAGCALLRMERIERPDRIDAGREVASVERELWMNEAVGVGMAEPEKEASVCTGDAGAVVVGDAGFAGTAADGASGLVAAGAVRGATGVGGVEITSFEVGIFPAGSIATGRVAETIGGVSLGIVPVGPAGRTLVGEAGFDATDAESDTFTFGRYTYTLGADSISATKIGRDAYSFYAYYPNLSGLGGEITCSAPEDLVWLCEGLCREGADGCVMKNGQYVIN